MSQQTNSYIYQAEIIRTSDHVGFGRREVPQSFLEAAREQVIFFGQRRGQIAPDAQSPAIIETPILKKGSNQEIEGIRIEAVEGGSIEHTFKTDLFKPFLSTMASQLVENKQLSSEVDIRYRVLAKKRNVTQHLDGEVVARIQRNPLPVVPGTLGDYLSNASLVGEMIDLDCPVIVQEEVLERAHELVWERNRERGIWLVGNLYQQTEPSPEIFAVIHTAIEARGATHERFSLDFSTETFTHADAQLELRRKRLGKVGELLLGFFHSHPFLPSMLDGKEACPSCPLRGGCKLTSSFFSQKDAQFHEAIFGRAPYAVEMVLGLTPREEFDLKMFTYDGGGFRERGYYLLDKTPAVESGKRTIALPMT